MSIILISLQCCHLQTVQRALRLYIIIEYYIRVDSLFLLNIVDLPLRSRFSFAVNILSHSSTARFHGIFNITILLLFLPLKLYREPISHIHIIYYYFIQCSLAVRNYESCISTQDDSPSIVILVDIIFLNCYVLKQTSIK